MNRIPTHSGAVVDMDDLANADIRLIDISYGLSNLTRWAGQLGRFTVAEHSALVAWLLRDTSPFTQFIGLIHDAPESYLGEVPRHVKVLCQEYTKKEFLLWERILDVLTKTYMPNLDDRATDSYSEVKLVDSVAAIAELVHAKKIPISFKESTYVDSLTKARYRLRLVRKDRRYIEVVPEGERGFLIPASREKCPTWEYMVFDVLGVPV